MDKSDDNFDDFDLGDDLDDTWDDSIDETDSIDGADVGDGKGDGKKTASRSGDAKSKKIKIIKPIVALGVLGSAIYLFLPVLMPQNEQNQVPVVKIDEAKPESQGEKSQDTKSQDSDVAGIAMDGGISENIEALDELDAPSFASPTEKTGLAPHVNPLETDNSDYSDILTPMPEEFADAMPVLEDVNTIPQIEEGNNGLAELLLAENAPLEVAPQEIEVREVLVEDDLFSKTETSFESAESPNVDDAIQDIMSFKESSNIGKEEPQVAALEEIEEVFSMDDALDAANAANTVDVLEIADTTDVANTTSIDDEVVNNVGDIPSIEKDTAVDVNETSLVAEMEKPIETVAEIEKPAVIAPVAKPITKIEKPKKTKAVVKKKKPAQKKPIWVIRGAQSGSAIIYDKISKEMKSVEVNDIVKGVGRIKSIKIIDGIWVIVGTKGKITQ